MFFIAYKGEDKSLEYIQKGAIRRIGDCFKPKQIFRNINAMRYKRLKSKVVTLLSHCSQLIKCGIFRANSGFLRISAHFCGIIEG